MTKNFSVIIFYMLHFQKIFVLGVKAVGGGHMRIFLLLSKDASNK